MKRLLVLIFIFSYFHIAIFSAEHSEWPAATATSKAGARWWWLGSAVDNANLTYNLEQYAAAGIGQLEITPIYGVKGNDARELQYLSAPWMQALRHTEAEGARLGINIDMATGTGWPFGGPNVPISEAACKAVFVDTTTTVAALRSFNLIVPQKERQYAQLNKVMFYAEANGGKHVYDITRFTKDGHIAYSNRNVPASAKCRIIALYISRTRQKVKRAAPGGEGYVIDHFDSTAVAHYLAGIEQAFQQTATPYPRSFFNDSYEVYGADWTPTLLDEFRARRGYALENRFPEFLAGNPRTMSDYRETLSDMLLHNFTEQWTAWAHRHGATTRNQAHGSPANLIDIYAAVDVPEIEGFGLSDFGIKGLRKDPGFTRPNFSDVSMLKYAPSAAHITGKPLTSSETFTWLTEHFRTSLSQMKPDLDLMFSCGVNHVFFHGTCYSPKDDPWPGWKFYASVDMSPTNTIWRDAPALMQYIDRCQRFLQQGEPDNDFLVYLPVRDMWKENTSDRLMQFDIHSMAKKAPRFIADVLAIDSLGYDCDYISDQYLLTTTYTDGALRTAAGTTYRAIVLPTGCTIPDNVQEHLDALQDAGARVIYGIKPQRFAAAAAAEPMRKAGLRALRRKNADGTLTYFVANLTPHDITTALAATATCYNPMNGDITEGLDTLLLRSGESRILVSAAQTAAISNAGRFMPATTMPLDGKWTLSVNGNTYNLDAPKTWEDVQPTFAGTGTYTTTVTLSAEQAAKRWAIDLGDVRESAQVYINNECIGTAWAVPFTLCTKGKLHEGQNEIRIEVTNLPANRIADLDRQGVQWRKFKEINIVDINYKKTTYADWKPVPSGLNSAVTLIAN